MALEARDSCGKISHMATLTESMRKSSSQPQLRAFDARRDLAAVAGLVEKCFADTLDESGREYIRRMRASAAQTTWLAWGQLAAGLYGAPFTGYVWQEDDILAGNASLIPYFNQGHWFYLIANVAVLPEYRRRGIARQLTQKCIEHARQRHMPSIWLHVRQENEGAKNLYQSLGFVARACRTSWLHPLTEISAEFAAGAQLNIPGANHWEVQRNWLNQNYPSELTWHLPFNLNSLRPDLWGGFIRFLRDAYILQWGAFQDRQLLAALSWQVTTGPANLFWLAAPPDLDENVLRSLLLHACHHLPTRRPVMLDYPAGLFEHALQSVGFKAQQTLIWMELQLR